MYILGDIGNSDTKLCLVSTRNKIVKKINFPSKNLNDQKLTRYFNSLKPNFKKINKILFCSVVPKSFNLIKKFLSKKTKIKCYEVKNLDLKRLKAQTILQLELLKVQTLNLVWLQLSHNQVVKDNMEKNGYLIKEIFL